MWTSALEVLKNVHDDGAFNDYRGMEASLIEKIENYQFVLDEAFVGDDKLVVTCLTTKVSEYYSRHAID